MKQFLCISLIAVFFASCSKTNVTPSGHASDSTVNNGPPTILGNNDSSGFAWYSLSYADAYGNTFNWVDSFTLHANYFTAIGGVADTLTYTQNYFGGFSVNLPDSACEISWANTPDNNNGVLQIGESYSDATGTSVFFHYFQLNVANEPNGYGQYGYNINPGAGDTFTIAGDSTTGKMDIEGGSSNGEQSYYLRVAWKNLKYK
jgi:hypothetical protein